MFAKAKAVVDDVVTQSDISDDYVGVRTEARPDVRRGPGGRLRPDWWVIVVAVLAGLLLLVIISLCLWKLGFFERRRRPPADSSPSPLDDEDDFMVSAHFEKVRLNGNDS